MIPTPADLALASALSARLAALTELAGAITSAHDRLGALLQSAQAVLSEARDLVEAAERARWTAPRREPDRL